MKDIKLYDSVLEETTHFETWDDLKEWLHHSFTPEFHHVIDELVAARKMDRWTGDIEAYLAIKITTRETR